MGRSLVQSEVLRVFVCVCVRVCVSGCVCVCAGVCVGGVSSLRK